MVDNAGEADDVPFNGNGGDEGMVWVCGGPSSCRLGDNGDVFRSCSWRDAADDNLGRSNWNSSSSASSCIFDGSSTSSRLVS